MRVFFIISSCEFLHAGNLQTPGKRFCQGILEVWAAITRGIVGEFPTLHPSLGRAASRRSAAVQRIVKT
jgi:hypothetical protein